MVAGDDVVQLVAVPAIPGEHGQVGDPGQSDDETHQLPCERAGYSRHAGANASVSSAPSQPRPPQQSRIWAGHQPLFQPRSGLYRPHGANSTDEAVRGRLAPVGFGL